jgi:energy-converting hydrogenase A subunit M
MALLDVVSIIMVKETKLIRFIVFESLVIGGGYCTKFFSFMKAKTSTHMVVRGVVRSSRNVKQS